MTHSSVATHSEFVLLSGTTKQSVYSLFRRVCKTLAECVCKRCDECVSFAGESDRRERLECSDKQNKRSCGERVCRQTQQRSHTLRVCFAVRHDARIVSRSVRNDENREEFGASKRKTFFL